MLVAACFANALTGFALLYVVYVGGQWDAPRGRWNKIPEDWRRFCGWSFLLGSMMMLLGMVSMLVSVRRGF